jgi:hypothetical protein
MIHFQQFLAEEERKHLTHIEDAILFGDTEDAITFLNNITDMLSGSGSVAVNLTVKWDGAPAIIAGTDPQSGKFFVGTKSVFNKTPKLNFTMADIKKNHSGPLGKILAQALKEFSKIKIRGVVQGDLLFSNVSPTAAKNTQTLDGEPHIVFQPNTIVYAVPKDSDFGRTIDKAKIGIIWHTQYRGRDISKMTASPLLSVKGMKKTTSTWFDDAKFRDASGKATFTKGETAALQKLISQAQSQFTKSTDQINSIAKNDKLQTQILQYINDEVKRGSIQPSAKQFIAWVQEYETAKKDKLKSEKGKEKKQKQIDSSIKELNKIKGNLKILFQLHFTIAQAKQQILDKLSKVKSIGTFLRDKDGLRVTSPEGFVAVDRIGKAVKLVDRLEFAAANFQNAASRFGV